MLGTVPTTKEKQRAREAVKRAVKAGKLVKPDRCEGCGETAMKLQAHHGDYAKQLDVDWLCIDCHALRHCEAGDMDDSHFNFIFRNSEIVQIRHEDQSAFYDWRNWPPN